MEHRQMLFPDMSERLQLLRHRLVLQLLLAQEQLRLLKLQVLQLQAV
jgi:hypothetical protein